MLPRSATVKPVYSGARCYGIKDRNRRREAVVDHLTSSTALTILSQQPEAGRCWVWFVISRPVPEAAVREGVAGTGEVAGQRHHAPRIRPEICLIRPNRARFVPTRARFVPFWVLRLVDARCVCKTARVRAGF